MDGIWLSDFTSRRPAYETEQARLLEWIARIHAVAAAALDGLSRTEQDAFRERLSRVIGRCACSPAQIARRGHVAPEFYDDSASPLGPDTLDRTRYFDEVARDTFRGFYERVDEPPRDLIHVTCTGYISPSAAQRLVSAKGWGARTRVTHAYHMGCYAALPAVRLAAGARGADIVHTEMCSLHFDPTEHSLEQLVVQSLFGDGFIRYRATTAPSGPALRVLAEHEVIVEDSAEAMTWVVGARGMEMTLSRDVPDRIAGRLRGIVAALGVTDLRATVCAVHPGGPKIIDRVRDGLELTEPQVAASRAVLHDFGNMSSATLPHVWMRILEDPAIAPGTPVLSLAFGPGLTIAAALFRKE